LGHLFFNIKQQQLETGEKSTNFKLFVILPCPKGFLYLKLLSQQKHCFRQGWEAN